MKKAALLIAGCVGALLMTFYVSLLPTRPAAYYPPAPVRPVAFVPMSHRREPIAPRTTVRVVTPSPTYTPNYPPTYYYPPACRPVSRVPQCHRPAPRCQAAKNYEGPRRRLAWRIFRWWAKRRLQRRLALWS